MSEVLKDNCTECLHNHICDKSVCAAPKFRRPFTFGASVYAGCTTQEALEPLRTMARIYELRRRFACVS